MSWLKRIKITVTCELPLAQPNGSNSTFCKPSLKAFSFIGWFCIVITALQVSCTTPDPKPPRPSQYTNAVVLDEAQRELRDIGWVSLANVSLSKPDPRFAFELTDGPNEYYKAARNDRSGSAAIFEQTALAAGLAAAVQADPTQMGQFAADMGAATRAIAAQTQIDAANAQAQQLRSDAAKTAYDAAVLKAETLPTEAQKLEAIAAAQTAYANALSGQPSPVSLPKVPSDNSSVPPAPINRATADIARSAFVSPNFSAMGALVGDKTSSVTPRSAIVTAAGDSAVEALLSMTFTPKADHSAGKIPLIGVATVSAEPGIRTSQGFEAVIDNQVSIDYAPAQYQENGILEHFLKENLEIPAKVQRKLADDAGIPKEKMKSSFPHLAKVDAACCVNEIPLSVRGGPTNELQRNPVGVVSVLSPLTEVRSYDVADSYRRRREMALDLSFALRSMGLGGQGSLFAQYARNLESDFDTIFEENSISGYSHGSFFGYVIRPQTVSEIGVKSKERVKTRKLLSQKPFPVLIHLTLDKADFKPYIGWDANDNWSVFVPRIRIASVPHWRPISVQGQAAMLKESERLTLYEKLHGFDTDSSPKSGAPDLAQTLTQSYKQKLGYSHITQGLPLEYIIAQIPFSSPKKEEIKADPLRITPKVIQFKIDKDFNTSPTQFTVKVEGENLAGYTRAEITMGGLLFTSPKLQLAAQDP